jgi:hypothetical protein
MTQENPSSDQLQEALRRLSMTQIRFCIARLEHKSDKDAAQSIGIAEQTVYSWENKSQVREVVELMRYDGMITALEIRRRNLAKAMAVKAAGLESDNEKVRQDVATELIEWELGKASQAVALQNPDGTPLTPVTIIEIFKSKDDTSV